jgi:hypothetical protein
LQPSAWVIAREDAPLGANISFRLCESCAKELATNIPLEFKEFEVDVLEQARADERAKVSAMYDHEIEKLKASYETLLMIKKKHDLGEVGVAAPDLSQFEEQTSQPDQEDEQTSQPDQQQTPNPDDEDDEEEFRCLDCGKEFQTRIALANHRRVHKQ